MAIPDLRSKHKLLPGTLKQEQSRQAVSRYKNMKWGPDECNPSSPHESDCSEILTVRSRRSPRFSCEDMTCRIHSELLATFLHQVTAFSYYLSLLGSNSIYSQYCGDILKNVFAQGALAILILSCSTSVHHIGTSDWCTSAFDGYIAIL